jgi:hypothetical protein
MRYLRGPVATTALVLLTVGPLGAGAPIATAEPATPVVTQVSEVPQPPGNTMFDDNPSIVDTRLQAIDSWTRLPDGHALAVHFTSGSPECYGVHAEVQETADIVAVKLRSGVLPGATQRICTMIAVPGTVTVGIPSPVGNRAVVSIT